MTRSEEEEVPVCCCPPHQDLASEDESKTLPELSEGSTAGSPEPEGILMMFHVPVSYRGCWVDKELLKTLSLTPGNHHYDPTYGLCKSLRPVRNLHYHFHSKNPHPYDTGVCNSQGTDYDFCWCVKGFTHFGCCLTQAPGHRDSCRNGGSGLRVARATCDDGRKDQSWP
jgi:hypothetical protein